MNLVGNAVKFTERGGVSILLKTRTGTCGEKLLAVVKELLEQQKNSENDNHPED